MMPFFGTVFKSLRFHLSTIETERFQNDAFQTGSTSETGCFRKPPFFSVIGRFSVDDRRKLMKDYAFL